MRSKALRWAALILWLAARPAAQVITTFAGGEFAFRGGDRPASDAPLGRVTGVAVDAAGNLYLADTSNQMVAKVNAAGILSIIAGNGFNGFSGDGGPGASAALSLTSGGTTFATGVAVDTAGNVYIADVRNFIIRRVDTRGIIRTVAGTPDRISVPNDGRPATQAYLFNPTGVATDTAGNFYIADANNYRIRKVGTDGIISTVAGSSGVASVPGFAGDGGPATSALLNRPEGVAVDAAGNLYIADTLNNRIRKVNASGIITTLAGGGVSLADGVPATSAMLNAPAGVAVDAAGNVYIADTDNDRVRKVTPAGIISTLAGGVRGFSGDGGPAVAAQLNRPKNVAVDAAGAVYVADTENRRVRKISAGGTITTVAGNGFFGYSGDGGPATSSSLQFPGGVSVDPAGALYFADAANQRIRRVRADGIIETVAGNGRQGFSGDGGPAVNATLRLPGDAGSLFFILDSRGNLTAADATGNLYIADAGNNRVRKVNAAGIISTVAGGGTLLGDGGPATSAKVADPRGVAVDAAGNLYIAERQENRIRRVTPSGTISTVVGDGFPGNSGDGGPAASARINGPYGVAVDSAGNLYIADTGNQRIRKVSGATIATIASGVAADNVAVDGAGNVYFAESTTHRVRRIDAGAAVAAIIAGTGSPGSAGDGGLATSAQLNTPRAVAVDSFGGVYIADTLNHRIRKIIPPPSFALSAARLAFSAPADAPAVAAQHIGISASTPGLPWSARSSQPWLTLAPAAGAAPAVLSAAINLAGLLPGVHRASLTVEAPLATPATRTVDVELNVQPALNPQLYVEPSSLVIEAAAVGANPAAALRIANLGPGSLSWNARAEALGGGAWLGVQTTSGSASGKVPAAVPLRFNLAGMPPGQYSGVVTVESTVGAPRYVPVTLLLSQTSKSILATQRGLQFTAVQGARNTAPQSLGILNAGQGALDWTVRASALSGGEWLSVFPASGTSVAGSADVPLADVTANAAGLSAGNYSALLRIDAPAANNSPYYVTAELEILPEGSGRRAQVRPPQLIFTAQTGSFSPGSQTVRLTTPRNTAVEARGGLITFEGGTWLDVLPRNLVLSAADPRTINVQPALSGLGPGIYRGAITFQFNDDTPPQVVDVFFLVTSGGLEAAGKPRESLACIPQRLLSADRALGRDFVATVGSPTALELLVMDDCGSPVTNATVVASFTNGDPPVTLTHLGNGVYAGGWRPVTAASPVGVTLRANLPPLPAAEVPALGEVRARSSATLLAPGGIVNGGSFEPGVGLAPGAIVSVFGSNLVSATAAAQQLPLPRTLDSTRLEIGGIDAPLFFASSGQINAQLPFELPPGARPQATIRKPNAASEPEVITMTAARPGIFTLSQDGKGQGAILHADGRLADARAPAAAGDVLAVYATGLGLTLPPGRTGEAAPSSPLSQVVTPVQAQIGGLPAVVHFAGLAPGFAGLYQVNVQVPAGVTPGPAVPLVLLQNGVPSNTVTIAVR